MGAYDGAEICELLLIEKKYDSENSGLYRGGGLSVFRNATGPKLKIYRKYSKKKC